jgi:hypothetical protein
LIEIEFDKNGNLIVCKIGIGKEVKRSKPLEISLRGLGIKYYGLEDPSVPKMLKYVIIPEMEVERIFNSLRLKYLTAIFEGVKKPIDYINAHFNKLFKALAGLSLRNDPGKKHAIKLLNDEGFKMNQMPIIDLEDEKKELGDILKYLFYVHKNDISQLYRELIAIKPGFHEIWLDLKHEAGHGEALKENTKKDRRTLILKEIHKQIKHSNITNSKIKSEINRNSFMTYATCNITEGPLVYRKKVDISYYEQLSKAPNNLDGNFVIGDYYGKVLRRTGISALKYFKYHNCIDKISHH